MLEAHLSESMLDKVELAYRTTYADGETLIVREGRVFYIVLGRDTDKCIKIIRKIIFKKKSKFVLDLSYHSRLDPLLIGLLAYFRYLSGSKHAITILNLRRQSEKMVVACALFKAMRIHYM
ncbi:MAG: hypothetical protein HQL50_13250 [Magnetococcales bacterium]|nr:hypothetical protein [Magnetococcales bacterium]